MLLAEFESIDVLWIVLSVFLVVIVIPLAVLLMRLGGTATRLGRLLEGLEESVPPLVTKTGGTVDRVNLQLDKVDLVTDSAVSAADSLDTTARAVSMAVVTPVQKLSGFAKGVSHGSSALFAGEGFSTAVGAGRTRRAVASRRSPRSWRGRTTGLPSVGRRRAPSRPPPPNRCHPDRHGGAGSGPFRARAERRQHAPLERLLATKDAAGRCGNAARHAGRFDRDLDRCRAPPRTERAAAHEQARPSPSIEEAGRAVRAPASSTGSRRRAA